MSKGNQRSKCQGGAVNWMEALKNIRPKGFRNIPQHLDRNEVLNRTNLINICNERAAITKRIRKHKINFNNQKISQYMKEGSVKQQRNDAAKPRKTKAQKIDEQIDRGYDVAERYGWVKKCKY